MSEMPVKDVCRYCGAHVRGDPTWTVTLKAGPCEACTEKLSKLIAAMPDPATTCGRVAPGGQGWCLKPVGHEVEDAAGKADPQHVVVTSFSSGGLFWWVDSEHDAEKMAATGERPADPFKRFKFEIEVPETLAPGEVSDLERWRRQIFSEVESPPVDVEVEIDGKPYLLKGLRPLGPPAPILLEGDEGVGEEAVQEYSFESVEARERPDDKEDEFPPHEGRAGYPGDGPPVMWRDPGGRRAEDEGRSDFTPIDMEAKIDAAFDFLEKMRDDEAAAAIEQPKAMARYVAQITACEALVAAVEADAPQGPEWWPALRVAYNTACRALGREPKH